MTLSKKIHLTPSSDRLRGCVVKSCSFLHFSSTLSETLSCNPTYPSCFDSKPITPTETEARWLVGILTLVTAQDSVWIKVAIAGVTFHAQSIYKPRWCFFLPRQTHILVLAPRRGRSKCLLLVVFSPHSNWPRRRQQPLRLTPIITKMESGVWCSVTARSISVILLLL